MQSYGIRVDLSGLLDAIPVVVDEKVFPLLRQAVEAVVQQVEIDWKQAVWQTPGVWIGEKQAYFKSIQSRFTGPFSAEVWTDYKLAEEIETGRPPKDLKRMLDSSLKVRMSKQGLRYLYIPFRHNTPGNEALAPAMPQEIYDIVGAKDFEKSLITGVGWRESGTGALSIRTRQGHNQIKGRVVQVATRKYVWGSRLGSGLAPKLRDHHKTDIYAGMVRMETSSGKQQSSKYLTFRTMSEKSKGWIIPARPGLHIAQGVSDRLQPLAEKAFAEAIKQDINLG
jgi:hypothetical protein